MYKSKETCNIMLAEYDKARQTTPRFFTPSSLKNICIKRENPAEIFISQTKNKLKIMLKATADMLAIAGIFVLCEA